jgi:inhibitor of KinA
MPVIALPGKISIYPLCEYALTIEFGNSIDESVFEKVIAFNDLVHAAPFPGVYQTVPAYASLTVFFDPLVVSRNIKFPGKTCFDKVRNYLASLEVVDNQSSHFLGGETVSVPVCYSDDFGPDLQLLAEHTKLEAAEVIRIHCEPIYTVFMIGFIPGFAYLGGLNPLLRSPRRESPRKRVPAGSVGIAGDQTGIYPLDTPGGWQIIGQTPLQLFNPGRQQPSLLKAGDRVRFEPISAEAFKKLKTQWRSGY